MANKISVVIDVAVDKANQALGNFRKSVGEAEGAVGKFKAGASSAGDSLKANIMPVAAAAGAAMVAFAAKSVQAASNLQESTNAVNVSFGRAAEGVLEIGENAAESMGLSERAFNEAAVGFAAFAETVAGPGGDTADVIGDITTRASDFASVMNLEVSEAANVFRSALSGETEPIKKFGIDLSAAAVEAYALSSGLAKSKGEMTEAIKVQARYGLLMERTSKFAGDFAETSDGMANSARIAAARFEDLQAKIGGQLLPVVEDATGLLLGLADAIESVGQNSIVKFGDELGLFNNIFGVTKDFWDKGPGSLLKMATGFEEATDASDEFGSSLVQQSIDAAFAERRQKDAQAAYEATTKATEEATTQTDAWAEALEDASDKWDHLTGQLDTNDAIRNTAEQFDDLAEAALLAWDAASTNAPDAEEKQRAYAQSVDDSKREVLALIDQLGKVPTEVTTQVLALIDEGKFAEAERRLAMLTTARDVYVRAIASGNPYQSSQAGTRSHAGSIVGGPSFAGVKDDEVPMILQRGEAVLTKGQQESVVDAMAGGGSGGGSPSVFNVTINADPNPDVTVRKLREWVRRNGPIQGLT